MWLGAWSFSCGFPAPRPPEALWLETGEPRIEWKETWEATYKANTERWRKELAAQTPDGLLREKRLSLRTVKLLRALVERFPSAEFTLSEAEGLRAGPAEPDRRIAAYREISDRLVGLACRSLANAYLKELVDDLPGRPEVATEALARILELSMASPGDMEDKAYWVKYAAGRLLALHRQGALREKHPALELAWKARLALHLEEGDFWEAARALDAMADPAHGQPAFPISDLRFPISRQDPTTTQPLLNRQSAIGNPQSAIAFIELLLAAGRGEDAFRALQELADQKGREQGQLRERLRQLAREREPEPDRFPTHSNLEMRWETVRARNVADDAENLRTLLEESTKANALIPWGEARHTSLWAAIDRHLLAQPADALAPLREAQGRQARSRAAPARADDWMVGWLDGWHSASLPVIQSSIHPIMQSFRRYPLASHVHDALLDLGERALRVGHSGLAFRAFQDVLSHGAAPAARGKAQVGLWLAVASDAREPQDIEAAFKGIAAEARFPWMGESRPAAFIKERLLAPWAGISDFRFPISDFKQGPHQPGAPPQSAIGNRQSAIPRLQALTLPAVAPWGGIPDFMEGPRPPAGGHGALFNRQSAMGNRQSDGPVAPFPPPSASVQVLGRKVLVSGPRLLACFGDDPSRPLWSRAATGVFPLASPPAGGRPDLTVPGPFLPTLADGRVFTRWGMDPARREMTGLAAFDADTGRMLWSTARDPEWEDLSPISDPAAADGRLYVLALREGFGARVPVFLVCLDAERGTMLWKRHLASQSPALPRAPGAPDLRAEQVDLAHYGNAPTVHRGAVYCSTNLGFVARCDARDGLVEWAATYPRVRLGRNLPRTLRRQGTPPLVAGSALVVAPRDFAGAFALDADTGGLLWDSPFVPSEDALGPVGGAVLFRDAEHLVAVEAATGNVVWERQFPEGIAHFRLGIVQSPTGHRQSASLFVGTRWGLLRLAAQTGQTLDESDWGAGEQLTDWAAISDCQFPISDSKPKPDDHGAPPQSAIGNRQSAILFVGLRGSALASEARGGPLNPQAPANAASLALRLPLKETWRLARPNPRLFTPPEQAKLPGKVFLFSEGVLECVAISPQGAIAWQRLLPPGFLDLAWAESLMLFVYPRRVLAVDASTGALRWDSEVPFVIRDWGVCGPFLFVGRLRDGRGGETALLRLATGERLWYRRFLDGLSGEFHCQFEQFAWDAPEPGRRDGPEPGRRDGPALHLFTNRFRMEGGDAPADFTVRPEDGVITAFRRFPSKDAKEGSWPVRLDFGEGFGFLVSPHRDRTLVEYSLADGSAARRAADFKGRDPNQIQRFEVTGPWLQVDWDRGSSPQPDKHWVLRHGDPAYFLSRGRFGAIRGDRLYEKAEEAAAVTVLDLLTRKEMTYQLPPIPNGEGLRSLLDVHEAGPALSRAEGATVWVASAWTPSGSRAPQLRLDAFARESGKHLGVQLLPIVLHAETQIAWAEGAVLVTDSCGAHGLVPLGPGETLDRPVHIAHFAPSPISADGSLRDWPSVEAIPLRGAGGAEGRLRLAHDGESLYLAVSYRDSDPLPRVGASDCGGGDWLEVGLATPTGSSHWGLGLDAHGHVLKDRFEGTEAADAVGVGIRHDAVTRELTYELALPLRGILKQDPDARRIGLSLAVWDDRPGGAISDLRFPISDFKPTQGPRDLLPQSAIGNWQSAIRREATVYLHPLTREQDEAAAAIVRELPDLPESSAVLRRACRIRASSPGALADFAWEFIRRHPTSAAAERLLFLLHETLGDMVYEGLSQKNVPEPVRRRFELQSKAYISQWVHIAPGNPPRSLLFELHDGTGSDGWEHRAFWGDPVHAWSVPPRRMGGRQDLPFSPHSQWHELRIPLYFVDMHDKPICGINFCQQGGPRIVWDRTALVFGGRETVLIDDEQPGGQTRRTWEWVTDPVKSGTRAHSNPVPEGSGSLSGHTLEELDAPITLHILPPLDRPYLSQWVYLDPASPPRTIAVSLHDGFRWRSRFLWGQRSVPCLYQGPLPVPGQWHELRLPLASTPFLARPIVGLAFGQCGGRAVWDRTALVVGGKETVLIEDEAPPLQAQSAERRASSVERKAQETKDAPRSTLHAPTLPARRAWHSWTDTHKGDTRPVPGKVGTGLWCDGKTGYVEAPPAPELDPPELTLEAWVCVDAFPAVGDTRRWIVNKNTHESTDGHFALVVNRDQAGAYLNIGGEERNRFQAWSRPGTLALKTWHHLAMTYDGANLRLYLDAELAALVPVHRARAAGTTSLQIGRRQDGYAYFEGIIDEVRLYSRALTAAELRGSYETAIRRPADRTGPPTSALDALVAAWSFDDDAPATDPTADWQWVDAPVKSGQRAHTQPPSKGYTDHLVFPLRDPVVAHLPFDRARAVAVLTQHIPKLGPTDDAWRFFGELLQLCPSDPTARGDLCTWFLRTLPEHPRAADALGRLLESRREAGDPDPPKTVEAFIQQASLPLRALYLYHRRYASGEEKRSFVQAWQLLGPFPNPGGKGFETRHPPETEGVKLDKGYPSAASGDGRALSVERRAQEAKDAPRSTLDAPRSTLHWRLHESEGAYINLKKLFEPNASVVAYAACWVHSETGQPVVLAIGSDDDCKVWLNGRPVVQASRLLAGKMPAPPLTGHAQTLRLRSGQAYASAGEFVAPAELAAGWNLVLLKISQDLGEWGFYFELLDPLARRLPDGLNIGATPP